MCRAEPMLLPLVRERRGMHAQLLALRRLVQLLDPPLFAHLEVG